MRQAVARPGLWPAPETSRSRARTGSRAGVLRHSAWDALLVGLSGAHAAILLAVPSAAAIALGLWWNANTVSHNFIHRPFFRSRLVNRSYAIYLSVLLGIPQSYWRARHLRHHAGGTGRIRLTGTMLVEAGLVIACWAAVCWFAPRFFARAYLPGYAIGLGLCALQGHFEHARGTTSHYGRIYNACFFNDGYHVEHHARPGAHWTDLCGARALDGHASRWPPVLGWLEAFSLDHLEHVVLRSPRLQAFVLSRHERAFRTHASTIAGVRRVTIVGGGLFPRTALILRTLLPEADLTVVDADARNIAIARRFLDDRVHFVHGAYPATGDEAADLLIVPLAYVGDRRALYCRPPAPLVLVHDWIWARHGPGVPVSWLLLKRLNLVRA